MSDQYPPAGGLVPIALTAAATLADMQQWTRTWLPAYEYLPLAAVAFGEPVIAPWATKEQLRPTGRMAVWAYALDDHVDDVVVDEAELDSFLDRCEAVVRTGEPDQGHPLLAALSAWQKEFAELPGYPALADVWAEKFASCLRGHRYDWVTGRARERGEAPAADVTEYLDHADSSAIGQVHVPRWVAYGDDKLPERLEVLVPALDDVSVATRLANDLATITRERTEAGQNNVLMYGVSDEWVRAELAARMAAVRERLAPLLAEDYLPAVGLVRLAEWSVGVYARHDMRIAAAISPAAATPTGVSSP